MGAYYLLRNTPPGADPLGPENTLSLFVGVMTGAAISGQSRVAAVAKSPVSGLADESAAGGFWPAELKFAGFDGVVIHGRPPLPKKVGMALDSGSYICSPGRQGLAVTAGCDLFSIRTEGRIVHPACAVVFLE